MMPDQDDETPAAFTEPSPEVTGVAESIQQLFEEEAKRVALERVDGAVERWVREHGLNVLPFPARGNEGDGWRRAGA